MRTIASDAEFAVTKFLAPLQQISSRARGLDAQLFQLRRGESEQGVPGWYLGGVRGEAAADGAQEGGVVWYEGYGFGDGARGD